MGHPARFRHGVGCYCMSRRTCIPVSHATCIPVTPTLEALKTSQPLRALFLSAAPQPRTGRDRIAARGPRSSSPWRFFRRRVPKKAAASRRRSPGRVRQSRLVDRRIRRLPRSGDAGCGAPPGALRGLLCLRGPRTGAHGHPIPRALQGGER